MTKTYHIAALYRFFEIENPSDFRQQLKAFLAPFDLCGTLLIAPEGINGTLAGQGESIPRLIGVLKQLTPLTDDDVKFSEAPEKPFGKLKLRLKREIITFKQPQADPAKQAGTYVSPELWNEVISDPEVLVLDTRNTYETALGMFKNAVDPSIQHFTDFAHYVKENLDPAKHKKVAMFCTGGIRCEKASAFMLAEGFETVYHLKGGILKYLETVAVQDSLWDGECYVFDRRVSVGHGLKSGHHTMCFACGAALSSEDKKHPQFEEGVSCFHCYKKTTLADKDRYRMRHQQLMLEVGASMEEPLDFSGT